MELLTPPPFEGVKKPLRRVGKHSFSIILPKKLLQRCGIQLDGEDYVYVYPVWNPKKDCWFLLIALNKGDWET